MSNPQYAPITLGGGYAPDDPEEAAERIVLERRRAAERRAEDGGSGHPAGACGPNALPPLPSGGPRPFLAGGLLDGGHTICPGEPQPEPGAALTFTQAYALSLLLMGMSVTAVARALNVRRQRISEWVNEPGPFRGEYDRQRREALEAGRQRLQGLLDTAIGTVEQAMAPGQPIAVQLKAAELVIRTIGYQHVAPPTVAELPGHARAARAARGGDAGEALLPGEVTVLPVRRLG